MSNAAYQALKSARAISERTAARRRKQHVPVEVGGKVMVFGDQFTTESGRSRKLQPRWRGPFTVLEFDEHTQNYTVSMDSRMYRRQQGVFHCSVIKPYHPNDDSRFPGRAHTKPAPILINEEQEWEVEWILDFRERPGRGQFLVKWKGYPSSENSWEPIEGLENAKDMVEAWWTDNMPGDEFPTIFSSFITVGFSPIRDGFEVFVDEPAVDKGFWEPHLHTDYDSEE